MESKIVKHGIAEISSIVAHTTLAPLAAAAQDESRDPADELESNPLDAKNKMQIRVSGISPPPLGWRGESVRIICTRCQAVFDLRREAGVFVKRLELRGLPPEWQTFCDTCGAAVVGGQLLVAVDAGATVAEVKEAIRGALTLRRGRVLSFAGDGA